METLFDTIGTEYALVYCSKIFAGEHYEMTALITGEERFQMFSSAERFEVFSDCMEGKDQLLDLYRDQFGRPVLGGLCSFNTKHRLYQVNIFEEKP